MTSNAKRGLRDRLQDLADPMPDIPGAGLIFTLLGVYLLGALIAGLYFSIEPEPFDVRDRASAYAAEVGGEVVTGSITTGALLGVMETLLEKPGGYLHNDRFPPGLWLDNIPNWEYGALVQVRDLSRAKETGSVE